MGKSRKKSSKTDTSNNNIEVKDMVQKNIEDHHSFKKITEKVGDFLKASELLNETQKEIILQHIEKNFEGAQNSPDTAIELFEEVKKNSLLKVTEGVVPQGILPEGYSCVLYDVKISTRGPDEKTYRKNKWIRDNVTRGMTFMRLTGEEQLFDFAIYANKKFTGGIGDEDDYQPESNDVWEEFCLDSPGNATEVICMTKVNGEAGHFTVRQIGGEYFIIAGSKNVHMLYKTYADIEKYTDSRYLVARTVAEAVLDTFGKMEELKGELLKQFLCHTKTTVVCELLQPHYQHIVDLSYLKKSILKGLMLASVAGNESVDSLTALPPHLCLTLFKIFQIPTPEWYSISVKDVNENILKMRYQKNSEGFVLYYLIEDRTIGLAKVKTIWYVLLRALREKVSYTFQAKKKQKTLREMVQATKKRFREIQKWLKFSDDCLEKWEDLAEALIYWLDEEIKADRRCPQNIRPTFPSIWKKFLRTKKNRNDDFSYAIT